MGDGNEKNPMQIYSLRYVYAVGILFVCRYVYVSIPYVYIPMHIISYLSVCMWCIYIYIMSR